MHFERKNAPFSAWYGSQISPPEQSRSRSKIIPFVPCPDSPWFHGAITNDWFPLLAISDTSTEKDNRESVVELARFLNVCSDGYSGSLLISMLTDVLSQRGVDNLNRPRWRGENVPLWIGSPDNTYVADDGRSRESEYLVISHLDPNNASVPPWGIARD